MKKIYSILFLLLSFGISAQTFTIKGTVTDEFNTPVMGANVIIKGTSIGTITDMDGVYQLTNITSGNHIVSVSYIGFTTQDKSVNITSDITLDFTIQQGVLLEELIVTAQKREQSIKDIPTALTSLSGKFIEDLASTEIDRLADYMPGVQMQVQSPNNPGFVVRGITSDDGASNIEPRVSVFQDGVSISKSRGSVVEIFDMERVEVLKGPQGTLFGRGAQIGALHFIQNKPKNFTEGGVKAGFGNFAYKHLEAFGNTPIVKDKLFARVSGIYKQREGFIENLSGGTLNGKDTKAIRASLKWKPSETTDFTAIFNYQKDTPPGTGFKSGTYAPKGGDTNFYTFADLERGEELGIDRTVMGTTLLGKIELSPAITLNSITAYRTFDSDEAFDADGTAAPALFFREQAEGKQFSQELRLNFNIGDKFEGFAGANFFMENGSQRVSLLTDERSFFTLISPLLSKSLDIKKDIDKLLIDPLNNLHQMLSPGYQEFSLKAFPLVSNGIPVLLNNASTLLNNPLIPITSIPVGVIQAKPDIKTLYYLLQSPLNKSHSEYYKNYGDNKSYEFFADGTYKISDQLRATAGIRFTIENITSSYESDGDDKALLGFVRSAGKNILTMPTSKISHSENFKSWVGRFALNYSITDNDEIYASVAKGRRPNVIQFESTPKNDGTFTSAYTPEVLKEETVRSYEVGFKTLSAEGNLYFDLAGFYYDYSNFQTSVVDPNSLRIVTADAGDASAYGAETSVKWSVSRKLSLFGNYSYIDAKFKDKDSDGNKQAYAGNTFRLTPKHSFALGTNVSFPLVRDKVDAFFIPTYKYKSKIYFEEDNKEVESQEGYGLLDIRTGVEFTKLNLKVTLFVNNATDTKYLIDAGNTGRSFGIPTFIPGMPRFYGIETSFRF